MVWMRNVLLGFTKVYSLKEKIIFKGSHIPKGILYWIVSDRENPLF